jgi:hypothetical protein
MKITKSLLAYIKGRLPLVLLLVCTVSCVVVSAVYAKYIKDVDKGIDMNVVSQGDVNIEVVEIGEGKYSIRHAEGSKIPAYIRFTVVVNWKNKNNGTLWYVSPSTVTVNADCAQKLSDGYYYCVVDRKAEIAVGKVLSGIQVTTTATKPGEEYELDVQILAEAIQCLPAGVVEEAWGATFDGTAWSKT